MNHVRVGDLTHDAFWSEPNRVLFYGGNINPSQLAIYARHKKLPAFFASSDFQERMSSTLCGDTPFLTVAAGVLQNHQGDIASIFEQCSIEVPPILELLVLDPVGKLHDIEVVKMGIGAPLAGVVHAIDPRGLFIINGKEEIRRVFNSGLLEIKNIQPYISRLVKEWVKEKAEHKRIITGLMGILSAEITEGTWVHELFLEQLRQGGITIPEGDITFTLNHELAEIYFE